MSKASVYFTLEGAGEKRDARKIKRDLDSLKGVQSVAVSGNQVAVDYDTTGVDRDRIREKLENLGYAVMNVRTENHG
ncbi:MAG: heavy-metal-associated domain-containing protein [Oscillospiraceae bacterium]|jgi:copper chaperone CopZ